MVALLWLEVQHPARRRRPGTPPRSAPAWSPTCSRPTSPSRAPPAGRLLRRQAKLLLAGACLLALGAGFAMLPAAGPGAGSALLRVLAAAAVIAAAALVLPGRD